MCKFANHMHKNEMNRLISTLILISTVTFTGFCAKISDKEAEKALDMLDKEIGNRNVYIERRQQRIDSIKHRLNSNASLPRQLEFTMQIGDLYNAFHNDSALVYYTRGYDMARANNDDANAFRFKVKRATLLPLSGFVSEALTEFQSIDRTALPESELPLYYESGRQMYSYISSFFTNHPETHAYWDSLVKANRDSLFNVIDHSSMTYVLNHGEALIEEGNYAKARSVLLDLLNHITPTSNLYARAAHMLAIIARENEDDVEEMYYLAQSAMADIKGAVREVMSLQELGKMMSDKGDINRAYDYLSVALTNAVECNASMRIVQSSEALPIIQRAHSDQAYAWRQRIYLVISIIVVTLIILIAVLVALRKQMRKQEQLKFKLQNANQVKEIYISQFFRLCSIYIDKLNQFCKIANRKISLGQVDELYKITKSGKLVEEQSEEFYKLFDDAFLHIYPTFVEDVNKLLREKIVLREGELLNNDLRILAFMRLGLDDTNQVALILNYSVNTIYAYRNKIRNRAFDRDNFEQDVMKIGAIYE